VKFELRSPARGSTGPWRRKNKARITKAAARTTDRAAFGARDEIRAAMRSQRLGNLANAIAATSDVRKGRPGGRGGDKLDVAGFVTTRIRSPRTAGALASYVEQDTTEIGPKGRGKWLALPTNEIPQRAGRRRMTPELYREKGFEERIGPLTFIPGRRGQVAYLVVKDTTIQLARKGKARRLPKRGRVGAGRARVGLVAFVLIRRTRRQRRVAPREIAQRWLRQLPSMLRDDLGRSR
jgi:hypothetical protein